MDTTKHTSERVYMMRDGLYVRGWSPTHQQAICTPDRTKARTWPSSCHAINWGMRQPGWGNAGGSTAHTVHRSHS